MRHSEIVRGLVRGRPRKKISVEKLYGSCLAPGNLIRTLQASGAGKNDSKKIYLAGSGK